jgi:hypothetical protein
LGLAEVETQTQHKSVARAKLGFLGIAMESDGPIVTQSRKYDGQCYDEGTKTYGLGAGAGAGAGARAGGEAGEDGAEYLHVDGEDREVHTASILLRGSGRPAVGWGVAGRSRRNRPEKTGREEEDSRWLGAARWGLGRRRAQRRKLIGRPSLSEIRAH